MSANAASFDAELKEESHFSARVIFTVVILTIASFMEALDVSIANVSLPNIAGSLSATEQEASWVISSYLVANAAVIPISGWLATYFGRKKFYMACVAIFVAASFLCGIATNLEMLIFFRILQGIGGGSLIPLEQAFIADTVPPEKRGLAFSIYGLTLVVAPILGPTIGGWVTDNYSWHWIFFINIPIGLISLLLTWNFVREPKSTIEEREALKKENFKVDWVGIVLFVVGIAALTIVLDKGNHEDWFESNFIITFAIIAFVALLIGITWEMYQKNPAVDIRLLANRSVAGGSLMLFSIAVMIYGSLVLIPLMAQSLFGYNATTAGLIMSPGGIITIFLMPTVGFLIKKIEARILIIVGLSFSALALWHLTSLTLNVSFQDLVLARVFQSFGSAFLFVPITTAAFRGVPRGKIDNASALMSLGVNLGGSFGIALLATFLSQRTQYHTLTIAAHASDYNPNYIQWISDKASILEQRGLSALEAASQAKGMMWTEMQRQAGMLAFLDAFYLLMILVLCMIPLVLLFRTGNEEKSDGNH